jgi:hypothetical protein
MGVEVKHMGVGGGGEAHGGWVWRWSTWEWRWSTRGLGVEAESKKLSIRWWVVSLLTCRIWKHASSVVLLDSADTQSHSVTITPLNPQCHPFHYSSSQYPYRVHFIPLSSWLVTGTGGRSLPLSTVSHTHPDPTGASDSLTWLVLVHSISVLWYQRALSNT